MDPYADDPIPLPLRIQVALTQSLNQIAYTYKDGPTIPMTDRVFRGRVIFGAKDPLPMLSILEHPLPEEQYPVPVDSVASSGDWRLLIQGFVDDDFENPTDPAHWLMAFTKQRLALEKRRASDFDILGLGKHITNLRIGKGVVRPPDEISAKAYFWLNVTLDVVEDLSLPFEFNR